MNDKEHAKWLKEVWVPFNKWKGKIDMRVARLEVRTKLALATSAFLKAQAELRGLQGATAGRRGGAPTRVTPSGRGASEKGGRQRRGAGIGS
jgi:hypothetical protein